MSIQACPSGVEAASCRLDEFEEFQPKSSTVNWNDIQQARREKDFELLREKDLFLIEAERLFAFTETIKNFDVTTSWFEYQWSEQSDAIAAITNNIIPEALELSQLQDFDSLLKVWLERKSWSWHKFETIRKLLTSSK